MARTISLKLRPNSGYMDSWEVKERLDASLASFGLKSRTVIEDDVYRIHVSSQVEEEFLKYVRTILPELSIYR